jgi:hypothetical protein
VPREDAIHYPLSFQQEEELRDYRANPGYAASSCAVQLFRLSRAVDTVCLHHAIDDLVARHAALRTTIGWRGSDYAQVVHEALPRSPSGAPRPESTETLARQLVQTRHSVGDIQDGRPLFRAELHDVNGGALLSLMIQHLVFDGSSLTILWRDLAEFYTARLVGRKPELPMLPLSYGEFAKEQRAAWSDLRDSALPFWSAVVAGYPGTVSWPSMLADAPADDHPAGSHRFDLPAECVTETRALARAGRVSPFIVLQCATGVALARVLEQRDLLLGTDFANRENPATRHVVGFLSNIRMTRIDLRGARSLTDLVASVGAQWRAAEAHRDAHIGPVRRALGDPQFIKVAMELARTEHQTRSLTLPGVDIEELPLAVSNPYWRKLKVQWSGGKSGYAGEVVFQPSAIDWALPVAIGVEIVDVLRAPADRL